MLHDLPEGDLGAEKVDGPLGENALVVLVYNLGERYQYKSINPGRTQGLCAHLFGHYRYENNGMVIVSYMADSYVEYKVGLPSLQGPSGLGGAA